MIAMNAGRMLNILLVEDNPVDARLTREALREGKVHNAIHVVTDGADAMAFLRRETEYADAPRPDLILLDLNLPRMDGREVLQEIKQDESLRCIPVAILTTSQAEKDILASYNLHANCYIAKPVEFDEFIRVVRGIEDFWLSIVKLPTQ